MQRKARSQKVLLIEDSRLQRRLVAKQLHRHDYEVIEAEDGRQGIDLWQQDPDIRLVITDLVMPVMDGFEVIKTIRSQERQATYVVVMTSLDDQESLLQALASGADDYLHKPILAEELNLRLRNASRLLKSESQNHLVFALAELAAFRSGETGAHLRRVRRYCSLLAEWLRANHPELGLDRSFVEDIANVSALHDIGKVGIPDAILNKPGKLSTEEFQCMKNHSLIGGDLLWKIYEENGSNYLLLAYQLTISHHERWNGTGYPDGLAGEAIPLAGRIMALADVFDALTSSRCYKEKFEFDRAKEIVLAERGEHFDPMLVDGFLAMEAQWQEVAANLAEDGGQSIARVASS